MRLRLFSTLVIAACTLAADELAREIWDQNFRSKRPATTSSAPRATEQPRYARSGPPPEKKAAVVVDKPVVGVTFWRLRLPSDRDIETPRLLVPVNPAGKAAEASKREYVAERLPPGSAVQRGDFLRLAIESPRDGYLYVINRERHRDGTTGEPFLIFPALQFDHGRNVVTPGRLVEIPAQSDRVPALEVTPRMEGHIGEDLLIVVSPEPIPSLRPGNGVSALPAEMVRRFEREWETAANRWDLMSSNVQTWTSSEQRAGSETPRLLTPADPMPQSIYSAASRENTPILIRIPLDVK